MQTENQNRSQEPVQTGKLVGVDLRRLVGFLRGVWAAVTHRHEWERTNDADMMDVPDCYPPTHIDYMSPCRRCKTCGSAEWYVGPEVCGGDRARWVPMPIDFSKPNDQGDGRRDETPPRQ